MMGKKWVRVYMWNFLSTYLEGHVGDLVPLIIMFFSFYKMSFHFFVFMFLK